MPSIQATAREPRTSQSAARPAWAIVVHHNLPGHPAGVGLGPSAEAEEEDMSAAAVADEDMLAVGVVVVAAAAAAAGVVPISALRKASFR